MAKTIVVPLDGSDAAARALPAATWLAEKLDADVRLLVTSFGADVAEEEAYLASQAASTGLVHISSAVLRKVFPPRGIVEAVDALPDGVLCMTTRGRGAVAEFLLGSVSDAVLREATAPIVLVGPACDPVEAQTSKEMVVAVDGSAGSLEAVTTAATWARELHLDVHLVTVEPPGLPEDVYDPARSKALTAGAAILDAAGVAVERHVLASKHPADSLVAFTVGLHAALVAIGTHGHGLGGAALGHVALQVVRHSPCPVLTRRTT